MTDVAEKSKRLEDQPTPEPVRDPTVVKALLGIQARYKGHDFGLRYVTTAYGTAQVR